MNLRITTDVLNRCLSRASTTEHSQSSLAMFGNPEYADQGPWLPTSPQNVQYSYLPNKEWITEVNEEQSNRYFEWIGK